MIFFSFCLSTINYSSLTSFLNPYSFLEDCFNSCSTSTHGSLLFLSSSFHCDIIIIIVALVSAFFTWHFYPCSKFCCMSSQQPLFVLIKATAFGPTPRAVTCNVPRQTLLFFPPPILPSGVNSHAAHQHKDAQTKFSVCNYHYLQNFVFFSLCRHSDFHICPSLCTWGSRKKEQRHKVEEKHHRLANNWLVHGLLLIVTLLLDSSLSSIFHLDTCSSHICHIWHEWGWAGLFHCHGI